MIRSLMVGLDGTVSSQAGLSLAIRWAKQRNAMVVGLAVVDQPGIYDSHGLVLGHSNFERIDGMLVKERVVEADTLLGEAAILCAREGVAFKPLENLGTPYIEILQEAQRFDLIVLGQETHFMFGWKDRPDITLERVLAEASRPVLMVPSQVPDGETILVAFDGSLQASRTLQLYAESGLMTESDRIMVVTVHPSHREGARIADRAVDFLHAHEIRAKALPIQTNDHAAKVLLELIDVGAARMIVMGAFGQPVLREFFLGSTTQHLLRELTVPLFLAH